MILDHACPADEQRTTYVIESHCVTHTIKAIKDTTTGHWTVQEITADG